MSATATPEKLSTGRSLARAFTSWRTASVTLMSFSSGLPLGLVWIAIPDWMRKEGVDIRIVGLLTLAQAPWTFKFLWAPFLDRFSPPLGRRRGWAAIAQLALFVTTLGLAGVGNHPDTPWVVAALALAIAFAGASQDIAVDAYAVDALRPDEQAVAVGARNALYRAGLQLSGSAAITFAGLWGWPAVSAMLAGLYLPLFLATIKSPPVDSVAAPKSLREAVWQPFVGFLARHRALEILAFVLFYKLADNLVQALQRPFLIDKGYNDFDRGVVLFFIGLVGNIVGTAVGGLLTRPLGLGRALWIFGFFQIFSNVGYALLAHQPGVDRPLFWFAFSFETFSSGLGSGAFLVLLMRLTQKRFSATQYALFSSLFGLPRILSGPICGFAVDAVGWEPFFWSTLAAGIPGMLLLSRFVPWGVREPDFPIEPPKSREPLAPGALAARGLAGAAGGGVFAALTLALLAALKAMKATPTHAAEPFDLGRQLLALLSPEGGSGWVQIAGIVIFAAVCGLLTAAVAAARHGQAEEWVEDEGVVS
jgi:PAT family beta-lactamase induction signal transducer AmpG